MEYETFIGTVRASGGTTSKEITIPYKICEYAGILEGDTVKIMIKKMPPIKNVD